MDRTTIGTIYVAPEGDGKWLVHSDKAGENYGRFTEREDAISAGRSLAMDKGCTLIVKRTLKEVDYTEDYASVNR